MNIAIHFGDHPMFLNQFHIVASVKKTESPRINHRHIMVTWLHGDYISHNGSYYGCCGTIVVNFPAFFLAFHVASCPKELPTLLVARSRPLTNPLTITLRSTQSLGHCAK